MTNAPQRRRAERSRRKGKSNWENGENREVAGPEDCSRGGAWACSRSAGDWRCVAPTNRRRWDEGAEAGKRRAEVGIGIGFADPKAGISAPERQRELRGRREGWSRRWSGAEPESSEQSAGRVAGSCGVEPAHGSRAAGASIEVRLEHMSQEPRPSFLGAGWSLSVSRASSSFSPGEGGGACALGSAGGCGTTSRRSRE